MIEQFTYRQFTYRVRGRFVSGFEFSTELLVIAADAAEAEDEAISCMDSFESISDWHLTPEGSIAAEDTEIAMYRERGAFAVSDPAVLDPRG